MTVLHRAPKILREAESHLANCDAGPPDLLKDLRALARYFEGKRLLTSTQAAELLGVSSPNTIKNWLEGGHFPGAYQTKGGHWRFPLQEILDVKRELQASQNRNQKGELQIPLLEDGEDEAFPVF